MPLQFLFVDTDIRDQTERERGLLSSKIRSHNATIIHAKRKPTEKFAAQPLQRSFKQLTTRFHKAPPRASESTRQVVGNKTLRTGDSHGHDDSDEDDEEGPQSWQRLFALLYRQWQESVRTEFSGNVPKHIAIYQRMIVPTIQLAFDVFHVRNSHNYEFMQWMTHPTTSAYHAGAAGLQLLYDMQVSPGCGQTRQCLVHKVKAFEYLRQTISTSPSTVPDDELLVILSLATVERTVDVKAHQYHLEILAQIVAAQGGLERVADHPRCTILQFDAWWSLSTGLRFFSTPQPLPQPEAGADMILTRYRDQIDNIPIGFQAVILDGTFSSSIIETVIRLTFVYRRKRLERDAQGNIVGLPYTARPVCRTFQEACPALDAPGPNKEKFLALAVVLYCGIGFDSAPISSNGGLAARAELFKMLKQYVWDSDKQEEDNLHFWIWVVTICAWQNPAGNGLLRPGVELLQMLREGFPNLKQWNAAEDILKKFFWNRRLTGLLMTELRREGLS